ncbi:MAG: hypothetical protein AAB288_09010 [Acidobacteriota bacterium]
MSNETKLQPENLQQLDIRPTPREEMGLYPLDAFAYEFPGKEIWVEFEMPEFTAICPFSACTVASVTPGLRRATSS